jgi:hypothetical protein
MGAMRVVHSRWTIIITTLLAFARPGLAGPPYVSDDPEPTDHKHFEIYSFSNGTAKRDGVSGASGIDFNYGAAPDLQLTATLPLGYGFPVSGVAQAGLGNIEIAAKYRFLHQDTFGWDVAVFPRVFLPSRPPVADLQPSLLLPIWMQRDLGNGWIAFGGGGCVLSAAGPSQDSCLGGAVITRQITKNLQLGIELFHETGRVGTPPTTSLGIGMIYDLSETYHLLEYVRRGIQNAEQTDALSWYGAVLFTF